MEWDIFGIMWYLLEKILIFFGICIAGFIITFLVLKKFYKRENDQQNEIE